MGRWTQKDAAFARRLQQELPSWVADGLMSIEQADALAARYTSVDDADAGRFRQTLLIVIFSIMGAVLVGTGVILVVGSNWQLVPPWVKFSLLVLGMLGSYLLGYQWSVRTHARPIIGGALIFLGTWFYAATIIWICQTFNVRIETAHYLIIWGLPVLPLAYLLRSTPMLAQAVFTLGLWLLLVIIDKGQPDIVAICGVLLLFGVCFIALGDAHLRRWPHRIMHLPYQWYGLLLAFGALYVLTFLAAFDGYQDTPLPGSVSIVLASAILFLALALTLVGWFSQQHDSRTARGYAGFLVLLLVLGALLASIPAIFMAQDWDTQTVLPLISAIFFNVIFIAFILMNISLGVVRRQSALVSFSIFFFGILLITRYFDWVWGLLPNGLALIVGGITLLAIAWWLERTRRRLLAKPVAPTEEPAS